MLLLSAGSGPIISTLFREKSDAKLALGGPDPSEVPRSSHYRCASGFSPSLPGKIRFVWIQREVRLDARPRGFHLVTHEVVEAVPELRELRIGLASLFIQHTSASLTLNENASPDVRRDFATWFDQAVPDGAPYWSHTLEGPDDMPAHVKSSLTGGSLLLPVRDGALGLGTWQGIYLCEHRDSGGSRRLLVTAFGEPF